MECFINVYPTFITWFCDGQTGSEPCRKLNQTILDNIKNRFPNARHRIADHRPAKWCYVI